MSPFETQQRTLSWDERKQGSLPNNYFNQWDGSWGTPHFYKLKLTNFSSVIHIPLVECLRLLRVLELENCTDEVSIPSLPDLEELIIKWCPQIKELAYFPKITRLVVNDCFRMDLKNFQAPNLLYLDCKDCGYLFNLPFVNHVPSLTRLDCSSTAVRKIPDYPKLEILLCNHLLGLSTLPNCPKLEKLECTECMDIDHIPNQFSELQYLDCSYCDRIEQLPDFLHLSILLCKGLFRLVKIPIYPNMEKLDCSWCILLSEIPGYPIALKVLTCVGCSGLIELPPCDHVVHLDCSKCIQITFIPYEFSDLEYLRCNETGVECLSDFFYDKQPADGTVPRCNESGSSSSDEEEEESDSSSDEEEFEEDEWIDREREQRLQEYRNELGDGSLDQLRSIAYSQPVRNTIQDWNRDQAMLTSRGLYSEEEDGRLINFQDGEDQYNQEYLNKDVNNLIFMFPYGNDNNKYKAFGYTLKQILHDPFINVVYECMKGEDGEYIMNDNDQGYIPISMDNHPKAYIKISLDIQAYVPAEELLGAIESKERVFLLHHPQRIDRTYSLGVFVSRNNVSDSHCQRGTDKWIYSLRVCTPEKADIPPSTTILGKRIR